MEDLYLQDIYVYPVKSLGGVSLNEAEVQKTGLQHDRRWMLTDNDGRFLSQRTFPQMAMLQVTFIPEGLLVSHKRGILQPLVVPFNTTSKGEITVTIWEDTCKALVVNGDADKWFTEALGLNVQFVYMPPSTKRLVDKNYASNDEVVSFADAYPLMMIGQSSLIDLNSRLQSPVLMNRFRPNLVFNGGKPFCEDAFKTFRIGEVTLRAVKPCSRCVLTTVNQEDGVKGQEPLKTLAGYRAHNNKVYFGQNLLLANTGIIKTGNKIELLSTANES